MFKSILFRGGVAALTAAFVLTLFFGDGLAVGQDKKDGKAAAEKKDGGKAAGEKQVRKKPRGRLPAYFATVVNEKQREQVYSIQAKYGKQLEELQKQLKDLISERDKEIEAVLTPEQLADVKKKREEAANKRKKPAEKKSSE